MSQVSPSTNLLLVLLSRQGVRELLNSGLDHGLYILTQVDGNDNISSLLQPGNAIYSKDQATLTKYTA